MPKATSSASCVVSAGATGTGYVVFELTEFAQLAVEKMNNLPVLDRQIRVNLSAPEYGSVGLAL